MRCLGPQVRGQNTQAVMKGNAVILILAHPHVTHIDHINQSQKRDITYQALLEIHGLIRNLGADPILEVTQGLRGGLDHPRGQVVADQGVLLHILGHSLIPDPDTGQGQEPDQTLGIVQKPQHVPRKEMN